MRSAWKVLNLAHASVSIPPLIIKYEIGSSDYTVWITDLTLIWKESLDRKRIIRRSLDVDTSIDPSEDSDQLRLFLQRVGDALEQQPGTTLDLVQNDNDQSLLLQTLTPLPGSLKPLEWSIELVPASHSTLTAELVVPMLSQQVIANAEKASLLQQLKEKDQVIAKLTDKMQSDGVDLGRLFPGVAPKSSKLMSRQALGKSVKGIGGFDEHQWRNHFKNNVASSKGYAELVFDTFGTDLREQPETIQMPEYKNWWERLSQKGARANVPVREGPVSRLSHSAAEETFKQDEFQKQATPTKPKTASPSPKGREKRTETQHVKARARKQPQVNSDSTTDESDQDLQSAWRKTTALEKESLDHYTISIAARKTAPIPPQTRLDGKATHEAQQNPMPVPGASISEEHDSSSNGESSKARSGKVKDGRTTSDEAPALKPRTKLGKIGGKGRACHNNESYSHAGHMPPALVDRSSPTAVSHPSPEVGVMSKIEAESERRSRTAVLLQAPLPPRETSQERANRNREKLKRELESKSQAGAGTKKKRKF